MIHVTHEYGTRLDVEIVDVFVKKAVAMVFCRHVDRPDTAEVLIDGPGAFLLMKQPPVKGQRRVLEFRKGGPLGGHWGLVDAESSATTQVTRRDDSNVPSAGASVPTAGAGGRGA